MQAKNIYRDILYFALNFLQEKRIFLLAFFGSGGIVSGSFI